jgi:hypothetical protein
MFEILLDENSEADKREKVSAAPCVPAEGALCTQLQLLASGQWRTRERGACPSRWRKTGPKLIPLENSTNHKKNQE